MKWRKLGVVFAPRNSSGWMVSHAYLPTAIEIGGRIRVFLAFRDAQQVGRVGWIDVKPDDPTQILAVSKVPSLDVGRPGAFDDNGVSPLAVAKDGQRLRLYYAGWQLTPRARYLLFTGLAFSENEGESFSRHQETPVLDRSPQELIVRSGTHVMHHGGVWKAWYAAGSDLLESSNKTVPGYSMVYAESSDGINWPQKGRMAIIPRAPDEYGFGRPCVIEVGGTYHMWYSIRSHTEVYRLGYGTSKNGVDWQRHDDEVGISVSTTGWDSEMIGFASIVANQHGCFLFYNGNGYGQTGVGVAVLEDDGWIKA